MEQYCAAVAHSLSNVDFESISAVYYVDFSLKSMDFSKGDTSVKYWMLNFSKPVNVTSDFTKEIFDMQFYFKSKLLFSPAIRYSIAKYTQRKTEFNQYNKKIKIARGETMTKSINNCSSISKTRVLANMTDESLKPYIRREFDSSSNNHSGVKVRTEEENSKNAIQVIQKLFTKNYKMSLESNGLSKTKRHWVHLINKTRENDQVGVAYFTSQHIEKLCLYFNPKLFFSKNLQRTNENKSREKEVFGTTNANDVAVEMIIARKDNSSYHSSSHNSNTSLVANTKKKISDSKRLKRKRLNTVMILFYFLMLSWLVTNVGTKLSVLIKNSAIINPFFTKELSVVSKIYNQLITTQTFRKGLFAQDLFYKNKNERQSESGESNVGSKTVTSKTVIAPYDISHTTEYIEAFKLFNELASELHSDLKPLLLIKKDIELSKPEYIYHYLNIPQPYIFQGVVSDISSLTLIKNFDLQHKVGKLFNDDLFIKSDLEQNKLYIMEYLQQLRVFVEDFFGKDFGENDKLYFIYISVG